jgi:methionyl-tRNA formyltransferase
MNIRIVFMGSPEFALPSLKSLIENRYTVVGVVTQPDQPAGRGRKLTPPPVKTLAVELNLPIIQPQKLRMPGVIEQLRTWAPDIIIVVAFGQILPKEVLDLPKFGCINVHASLLPRWRGAAPIQAAILHGDHETGVTIMKMDSGLDTGPILKQKSIPIEPDDTAGSLSKRLSQLGSELLIETLPLYLHGELTPQPQDDAKASYAPMLKKADGELDFSKPASLLARQVRAFNPWPGAFTIWKGQAIKILRAHEVEDEHLTSKLPLLPGQTFIYQDQPAVCTGKGLFVLDEVQPAGKRPMEGKVFLRGARDWQNSLLGP